MSEELSLDDLVDAEVVAGVLDIQPNYVRQLVYKEILPVVREGRRMMFHLPTVVDAWIAYQENKGKGGRKTSVTEDGVVIRRQVPNDGMLLWDKRVRRLGWAVSEVVEQAPEDNFIMTRADSGNESPAKLTDILEGIDNGSIFVLEPGFVLDMVLKQLYKYKAPVEATDCLEAAKRHLHQWREKRLEEIDVAETGAYST